MKIKWLYVILFIVLLGAAAYMYMWSVGDEIGMHNAESVEEAVEAPEPSEAGESPGIMQTMGETLGCRALRTSRRRRHHRPCLRPPKQTATTMCAGV